jgi:Carbohydrate family 9 binding domain-like
MDEIVAKWTGREVELDAARSGAEWSGAQPISFCNDWQGLNSQPVLTTQVQALWSERTLFFRFECHYRSLCVFEDSDPNGRRYRLWDRDVVEAFVQPDASHRHAYKEFEVAPNGMWIDLDIFPGGHSDLRSGLRRSVVINEREQRWIAELAVPLRSVADKFDPTVAWGANFYRVEGVAEPRQYLAWQPTHTAEPNFHVPERFGILRFA